MRTLSACFLISLVATACATATPEPSILSLNDPSTLTEENFTVSTDPYIDQQRQNVFFRATFPRESVLAVYVTVENRRIEPVRIEPTAITVVMPGGDSLRPVEGKTLVDFLGIAPEPPPPFSTEALAEIASMTLEALAFQIATGNPYYVPHGRTRPERRRIRRRFLAKYKDMQLKDQLIGPGGVATGFVYFIDTRARNQFKLARLRLPIAEERQAAESELVIPFVGAAGRPSITFNQRPQDDPNPPSRGSAALVLMGPDNTAPVISAEDKSLYQPWQVRGYLLHHKDRFKKTMSDYNQQHRILVDERGGTRVAGIYKTKIKETRGDRVVLGVGLVVGVGVNETSDEVELEFEWRDDHLEVIGHRG